MIRPFTFLCMLGALGSGLYLYQCKHQAQMLDRDISRTIAQTNSARERIGMLQAEWARLNQPDRLSALAQEHTTLQLAKPSQFASMGDLASRLPAPAPATKMDLKPTDMAPDETPTTLPAPVAAAEPAPAAPAAPAAVARAEPPRPGARPDPAKKPDTKVADTSTPPTHRPDPAADAQHAPAARPTQVASRPASSVVAHTAVASTPDALAPGTVGAAVMQAMRQRQGHSGYAEAAPAPAPIQARTYQAPAVPVHVSAPPPSYAPPAYAPQAYAPPPAYAPPAYPTTSVLGARGALPPPVPFAAR